MASVPSICWISLSGSDLAGNHIFFFLLLAGNNDSKARDVVRRIQEATLNDKGSGDGAMADIVVITEGLSSSQEHWLGMRCKDEKCHGLIGIGKSFLCVLPVVLETVRRLGGTRSESITGNDITNAGIGSCNFVILWGRHWDCIRRQLCNFTCLDSLGSSQLLCPHWDFSGVQINPAGISLTSVLSVCFQDKLHVIWLVQFEEEMPIPVHNLRFQNTPLSTFAFCRKHVRCCTWVRERCLHIHIF